MSGSLILGFTILLLLLFAGIFRLLGFTYKDYATTGSKSKLQDLKRVLSTKTLFQIEKDYFQRLVAFAQPLKQWSKPFLLFVLFTFILNALAVPLFCYVVEFIKLGYSTEAAWIEITQHYEMYSNPAKLSGTLMLHATAGVLGVLIDWCSLRATIFLIEKMAKARYQILILAHILLDVLIIFTIGFLLIPIAAFFNWVYVNQDRWDTFGQALSSSFDDSLDWLIMFLFGCTSSLPTIIYLLSGLFVLCFKLIPGSIQRFIIDLITALTPKDRNLFKDLAAFLAGVASILGAAKFLLS